METTDNFALQKIRETVQHNCAISDARYARDYSLCIYLLRMREFYRWQNKISLGARITPDDLGTWVSDTEAHWDNIEETDFKAIPVDGQELDPFDAEAINRKLTDQGLVYSAGTGRFGQPHFVLAKQIHQTTHDQIACIHCGDELARDTITMPAMAQNNTVYIRHESNSQLLWQMYEEWNIKKSPGPMARLVSHYGIENNDQLNAQIANAANDLSHVLLQHELGEVTAGKLLGSNFQHMALAFQGKRGELQIRAVRDLLADSLCTWPTIIEMQAPHYFDFWLAGLNGYRENFLKPLLAPRLLRTDDPQTRLEILAGFVNTAQTHWQGVIADLLTQYQKHGIDFDVDKTINRE